jgi:hypothetical protein
MAISKKGSLFEAIHALLDADINVAVSGDKFPEFVFFAYVGGEIFVFDLHVFWLLHWGGQKVILEVSAEEASSSARIGDCAVDDELGFQKGSSG